MTDKSVSEPGKGIYVAPPEPPQARRPPITEVGLIRWLHKNLFSNVIDTIMTIITVVAVAYVLFHVFAWALTSAQWEVAFLNQRVLMNGQRFPIEELWRTKLLALIFVFLSLMSVGIWGRVTRGVVIAVVVVVALMVFVPILVQPVPEPTIYFYHDSQYKLHQVNFIAEEDQEFTFTVDPLTQEADFAISTLEGYVENDNQQSQTSFDAYNASINGVNPLAGREQTIDPSQYNLSIAIQIWDRDGNVVAQSDFTKGTTEPQSFTWSLDGTGDGEAEAEEDDRQATESLPAGWYTFTVVRDEDESFNTEGIAFIEIDGMEVFRSTIKGQEQRLETYGPEPELDCRNCATSVNRTDMRFQGERSLLQWFSLQLSPYVLEIRNFMIWAFIIGALGYLAGAIFRRVSFISDESAKPIQQVMLWFAGVWTLGFVGVWLTQQLTPEPVLGTIRTFIMMTIIVLLFIYALLLFLRKGEGLSARGMSLMWLLAIPVSIFLLTGFNTSEGAVAAGAEPPLPYIGTGLIGGLMLTMLLSAVAIIASFPVGILLALGRQSNLPVITVLCTVFIEVVRGVPLITLLFMGSLIVPFFGNVMGVDLGEVDTVIRIMVVLTMFMSAYLAEVIRGGLQIISKGQIEAAQAVGLNGFWITVLIVLPQALRAVIPAIMGQAVSLFKDTTLVYLIGLFDILGVMNQILSDSQSGYTTFQREGYLYLGIIYFLISYMMADISRRIERTGSGAVRRETM